MPEGGAFVPVPFVSLGAAVVVAIVSPLRCCRVCCLVDCVSASLCFCWQVGQPFQRSQTGHEAIFASAYLNELRQAMKAATHREFGDGKSSISLAVADNRILFRPVIDEIAVRHPLRLHEFKLLLQMCANQKENPATLLAIIFQGSFRQRWPIISTATQKVVEVYRHNLILQCIAWVHTPNVRTKRALQSLHVIFVAEGVIAV